MWESKTAADLRQRSIYVRKGEYHASAVEVIAPVTAEGGTVTVTARGLWTWPPDKEPTPVTLAAHTPVYILTCTCGGMAFICNRWVFTGECRCRHYPLPKEN